MITPNGMPVGVEWEGEFVVYCKRCGRQVDDNAKYCTACGTPIAEQPGGSNETSGIGFAVLGVFAPIAGFVLFLVFHDKKPRWSKYAGIGALVGAIAKAVISIILVVIYFAFASTWMNTMFEQYSRFLGDPESGAFGFTMPDEPDFESRLESALDHLQDEISSPFKDKSSPSKDESSRPFKDESSNPSKDEISSLFKEESTEEILEKYVDVTFGEFKTVEDGFLTSTSLDVTVRNKAEEMSTYFITVEAVDQDGARLGTDYIFAQSLRPGQTEHLTAFKFVNEQKLEQFQNATFRVLKIDKYEY